MSLPWESWRNTCRGQSTVRLPHQCAHWLAMTKGAVCALVRNDEGGAVCALLALRAAFGGCALHTSVGAAVRNDALMSLQIFTERAFLQLSRFRRENSCIFLDL